VLAVERFLTPKAFLLKRSRCRCAALIFKGFFFCRLASRQPFWKTEYAITQQLGRSIEGLWQLRCSLADVQCFYSSVQVAQQGIHCVGDFSGTPMSRLLSSGAPGMIAPADKLASRIPAMAWANAR